MSFIKLIKASCCLSIAFQLSGCSKKENNEPNKAAAAHEPVRQSIRRPREDLPGAQQLPSCIDFCGGGECVAPTGGAGEGYCAVNGQILGDVPCGPSVCVVERVELDCHDYCKDQALTAISPEFMPFMSGSQLEGNVQGAYTGYCELETVDGKPIDFPQCSGSSGFCTANQCSLAAAQNKRAKEGEMCAFSWEGSSFRQDIPGAAATVVVQYSGEVSGWRIHSMGCERQTADGRSSGYKITGPNQVSQCLADIETGVSQLPSMAQYNTAASIRAFSMEVQKLDFTLPAQAHLSNVLRGSQHLISCSQVLLKLNSHYTFNFLSAFQGGAQQRQVATEATRAIGGFRQFNTQYSVTSFESRAVTVEDYMLMYKDVGTKLSAMCFEGFNPVQSFCTERSVCRTDGVLAEGNMVVLEKDLKRGGNYRISKLQCKDLNQKEIDFDRDIVSWNKINLFLNKYLGSVPQDRRRKLINRIETSFHMNLDENMFSVMQMQEERSAYTEEMKAEIESMMGLSRFIAHSEDEDSKLSTCSRVFQDWASSEDMQFYVGDRLNAELQTRRDDSLLSHQQDKLEQKKMAAAKHIYSRVLGRNLYESMSPAFAQELEEGKTISAQNDAKLMADILCKVAKKAIDEPSIIDARSSSNTCAYTSPVMDQSQNTLYISMAAVSSDEQVRTAVAQAKMEFIRKRMSINSAQFNQRVQALMKGVKAQKKRDPREIVHGRPEGEESVSDSEEEQYNIEEETAEGRSMVMEISGVTCGERAGDPMPKWRHQSQSFSLEQIANKCRNSDLFVSWGQEEQGGEMSLKERFEGLVYTDIGKMQVMESDSEGDFCENVGFNMFSNFMQLNKNAFSERTSRHSRRAASLQTSEWSKFLSAAVPRVYAGSQTGSQLSTVQDAWKAGDVLCTIAWGCDMLPLTAQ